MIMGIPCLPAGRYVAKINKNKHMKNNQLTDREKNPGL